MTRRVLLPPPPPPVCPVRPKGHVEYQDGDGAVIVLHTPDVCDSQTRVLDAAGRSWRRRIGFCPPGKETR